jgi:hypothetical protein
MHLRAAGNFDARLNGALLLPAVPIAGEFETLLGHIALTISVRMLRFVLRISGVWKLGVFGVNLWFYLLKFCEEKFLADFEAIFANM